MIVVGSCYFLFTLLIPYDPNIGFVFPLRYSWYRSNVCRFSVKWYMVCLSCVFSFEMCNSVTLLHCTCLGVTVIHHRCISFDACSVLIIISPWFDSHRESVIICSLVHVWNATTVLPTDNAKIFGQYALNVAAPIYRPSCSFNQMHFCVKLVLPTRFSQIPGFMSW